MTVVKAAVVTVSPVRQIVPKTTPPAQPTHGVVPKFVNSLGDKVNCVKSSFGSTL